MKTIITMFAAAAIGLFGCGDNNKAADAALHHDSNNADAQCSNCPSAPALGPQMDRLGRPAINTVLNHGFDGNATTAGASKDAYNQDEAAGSWPATWAATFAAGLAIVDTLDTGFCGNGICESASPVLETTVSCPTDCPTITTTAGTACGNQVQYNGNLTGGGAAATTSYSMLAGILADDQLYLDTTQKVCNLSSNANYLAVEFTALTTVPNTSCGGRAPLNDVIDTSYSALAIGIKAFSTDGLFTPAFGDGVGPHADVSDDAFPFLGTPHP